MFKTPIRRCHPVKILPNLREKKHQSARESPSMGGMKTANAGEWPSFTTLVENGGNNTTSCFLPIFDPCHAQIQPPRSTGLLTCFSRRGSFGDPPSFSEALSDMCSSHVHWCVIQLNATVMTLHRLLRRESLVAVSWDHLIARWHKKSLYFKTSNASNRAVSMHFPFVIS